MFGRRRHKEILGRLDKLERDQTAAHGAMKNQLGEIHGQISGTLEKFDKAIDGIHKRITFNNMRPKP